MRFKTIIISDLHLGSRENKVKEVICFLKENNSETIILNGDIIDGWKLKRKMRWGYNDTKFLIEILKHSKKAKIKYIIGNHDEFLLKMIPLNFGNIDVLEDYIFEGINKRMYYVCHGNKFDYITSKLKIISLFGDLFYNLLLNLNKPYNQIRKMLKLEYVSLSKTAKRWVKKFYLNDDYYEKIKNYTYKKKCNGIILGHTHIPELNETNDHFHYLNSGDCSETGTILIEELSGEWKIIYLKS